MKRPATSNAHSISLANPTQFNNTLHKTPRTITRKATSYKSRTKACLPSSSSVCAYYPRHEDKSGQQNDSTHHATSSPARTGLRLDDDADLALRSRRQNCRSAVGVMREDWGGEGSGFVQSDGEVGVVVRFPGVRGVRCGRVCVLLFGVGGLLLLLFLLAAVVGGDFVGAHAADVSLVGFGLAVFEVVEGAVAMTGTVSCLFARTRKIKIAERSRRGRNKRKQGGKSPKLKDNTLNPVGVFLFFCEGNG